MSLWLLRRKKDKDPDSTPRLHGNFGTRRIVGRVVVAHVIFLVLVYGILHLSHDDKRVVREFAKVKIVSVADPKQVDTNRKPASSISRNSNTVVSTKKTYRTPAEIRNSGLISANSSTKLEQRSKYKIEKKRRLTKFREKIRSEISSYHETDFPSDRVEDDYFQLIVSHIYQLWDQPSKTEVGEVNPIVEIKVEVQKSGQITVKQIVSRSKIPAMDNSVSRLLKELRYFPPFPSHLKKESINKRIILELT